MRRDDVLDILEACGRRAADGHDAVVGLESGAGGSGVGDHLASDRKGDRPSRGGEQGREQHHREQEVRDRPGSHDQGTCAHPLLVEGSSRNPARHDVR